MAWFQDWEAQIDEDHKLTVYTNESLTRLKFVCFHHDFPQFPCSATFNSRELSKLGFDPRSPIESISSQIRDGVHGGRASIHRSEDGIYSDHCTTPFIQCSHIIISIADMGRSKREMRVPLPILDPASVKSFSGPIFTALSSLEGRRIMNGSEGVLPKVRSVMIEELKQKWLEKSKKQPSILLKNGSLLRVCGLGSDGRFDDDHNEDDELELDHARGLSGVASQLTDQTSKSTSIMMDDEFVSIHSRDRHCSSSRSMSKEKQRCIMRVSLSVALMRDIKSLDIGNFLLVFCDAFNTALDRIIVRKLLDGGDCSILCMEVSIEGNEENDHHHSGLASDGSIISDEKEEEEEQPSVLSRFSDFYRCLRSVRHLNEVGRFEVFAIDVILERCKEKTGSSSSSRRSSSTVGIASTSFSDTIEERSKVDINLQFTRFYSPKSIYWDGPCADGKDRGNIDYFCPEGWRRYAIQVSEPDRMPEILKGASVMYHSAAYESALNILLSGSVGSSEGCNAYAGGLYLSPSINYAAHPRYSTVWDIQHDQAGRHLSTNHRVTLVDDGLSEILSDDTCNFAQFVFEVRVRDLTIKDLKPETLVFSDEVKIDDHWPNEMLEYVIPDTGFDDIRAGEEDLPYLPVIHRTKKITVDTRAFVTGLLVRVTDYHPSLLSSSDWWWKSMCPPSSLYSEDQINQWLKMKEDGIIANYIDLDRHFDPFKTLDSQLGKKPRHFRAKSEPSSSMDRRGSSGGRSSSLSSSSSSSFGSINPLRQAGSLFGSLFQTR